MTLYFRRDKATNIFESGVDAEEWDALTAALGSLPKLPRSAVDEWGFETEGAARAWSAGTANAHAPYTKALDDYASAVRDFLQSSWRVFVAHPQIGRGTPEGREKVAANVQRVPDTINGFAEALVHVLDVLRPPADFNAFDRHALDLAWEHVHLVPLVRGRSIDRKAWKLLIAGLPQPDEDLTAHAWKFVPKPVSDEVWQSLELPTWPPTVGSSARRLAASAGAWRDAMRHVLNLRDVPLRDDLGKDVLSSHWREALAIADRAAADVATGLSALPNEIAAPQPELRETLQAIVASLRETLAAAGELDFGAIEEVVATIGDTIVPAVTVVADLWLDRELV